MHKLIEKIRSCTFFASLRARPTVCQLFLLWQWWSLWGVITSVVVDKHMRIAVMHGWYSYILALSGQHYVSIGLIGSVSHALMRTFLYLQCLSLLSVMLGVLVVLTFGLVVLLRISRESISMALRGLYLNAVLASLIEIVGIIFGHQASFLDAFTGYGVFLSILFLFLLFYFFLKRKKQIKNMTTHTTTREIT